MLTTSSIQVLPAANTDTSTYYLSLQPITAGKSPSEYTNVKLNYNPSTGLLTTSALTTSALISSSSSTGTLSADSLTVGSAFGGGGGSAYNTTLTSSSNGKSSGSLQLIFSNNGGPITGSNSSLQFNNQDLTTTSITNIQFAFNDAGSSSRHAGVIQAGKDYNAPGALNPWLASSGYYPNYISFWTRGVGNEVERMRIDSNGNIGIANTIPVANLDVNGSFNANGTANIAGNVYIGGALTVVGNTIIENTFINNAFVNTTDTLVVSNTTSATSTGSGALQVVGGAGIQGNVYTGNHVIVGAGNGVTFVDGTIQTTAGSSVANTVYLTGVNLTQNANIIGAFTQANSAGANTVYLQGGLNTANANTIYLQGGLNTANANSTLIFSLLNTANANMASIFAQANAAFLKANNAVANLGPVVTINTASYLYVPNTTVSTSNTTGALVISGGMGITGNLFMSAANNFYTTTASASYRLGWTDNYFMRDFVFNGMNFNGNYFSIASGQFYTQAGIFATFRGPINNDTGNNVVVISGTSGVLIQNNFSSTSNTTGALVVSGGIGAVGNIYSSNNLITTANVTLANSQGGTGATISYNVTAQSIDFFFR